MYAAFAHFSGKKIFRFDSIDPVFATFRFRSQLIEQAVEEKENPSDLSDVLANIYSPNEKMDGLCCLGSGPVASHVYVGNHLN